MPWKTSEAKLHTKSADTPSKKKKWAKIANGVLKASGDEGKAIRIANAAVSDRFWEDGFFLKDKWNKFAQKKFKDEWSEEARQAAAEARAAKKKQVAVSDPERDKIFEKYGQAQSRIREKNEREKANSSASLYRYDSKDKNMSDYRKPFTDAAYDREFSEEQRKEAAEKGQAMPGGGFPIKTTGDLKNAIKAIGRAGNREATIKHIKKRARALGETDLIPEKWGDSVVVEPPLFQEYDLLAGGNVVIKDSSEPAFQEASFAILGDSAPEKTSLTMYDSVELDDAAKVGFTSEGYLKAMPRIARTGIQIYRGRECNRDDMDLVRVYRPADAVFSKDAWQSYTHLPVTLDHPSVPVTADNWKKYAVGETADEVLRDGQAVRVPMMLRDSAAVAAWKAGKNQLSVGYDCDIRWTPGVTDDGEEYDAIQCNIKANHLAVVSKARGGDTLVIGDDEQTRIDYCSPILSSVHDEDNILFKDMGFSKVLS